MHVYRAMRFQISKNLDVNMEGFAETVTNVVLQLFAGIVKMFVRNV